MKKLFVLTLICFSGLYSNNSISFDDICKEVEIWQAEEAALESIVVSVLDTVDTITLKVGQFLETHIRVGLGVTLDAHLQNISNDNLSLESSIVSHPHHKKYVFRAQEVGSTELTFTLPRPVHPDSLQKKPQVKTINIVIED